MQSALLRIAYSRRQYAQIKTLAEVVADALVWNKNLEFFGLAHIKGKFNGENLRQLGISYQQIAGNISRH